MSEPTISVVLPNFNYAQYLPQTIDSILGQALSTDTMELIVVDDASTDDSRTVLERYEHDPRVRMVRHDQNRGYVHAYNEGMALARGRYIVSMDADDAVIDSDAFRDQAAILDSDERLGLVFGNFRVIDEHGATIGSRRIDVPRRMFAPAGARRLLMGNFIMHSGVMVRRAAIVALGAHDPRFFHSMDWELWLRIGTRYGLAHIDRYLYAYRVHSQNMHRGVSREGALVERKMLVEKASQLLKLAPGSALARRALGIGYVDRAAMHAARGEARFSLNDLGAALKIAPRSLISHAGWIAIGHLGLGVVLGPRRKTALLTRLRGWRSVPPRS